MRQQIWLELVKDYELEIHYHHGKVNVDADALNCKSHYNHLMIQPLTTCCDPEEPGLSVIPHSRLNHIALIPTIMEDVIAAQRMDIGMGHI
jgi:hypothetical protein